MYKCGELREVADSSGEDASVYGGIPNRVPGRGFTTDGVGLLIENDLPHFGEERTEVGAPVEGECEWAS